MPVVALDTHAVVKELQAAGFTEAQAEAVTRAVRKGQDIDLSGFATRADVQGLKVELDGLRKDFDGLRKDFEGLRQETKADIDGLRKELKADIEGLRKDTKADIEGLRKELTGDIEGLRKDTKADIAGLKFELLKWIIGAIGLQTVAILGAVLGLIRILAR